MDAAAQRVHALGGRCRSGDAAGRSTRRQSTLCQRCDASSPRSRRHSLCAARSSCRPLPGAYTLYASVAQRMPSKLTLRDARRAARHERVAHDAVAAPRVSEAASTKKRKLAPELTENSIRSASLGYGGSATSASFQLRFSCSSFPVALAARPASWFVFCAAAARPRRSSAEHAGEQRPQARSPASDCAHLGRHLHAGPVLRMVDADDKAGAAACSAARMPCVELEAHEMHRRGLLLVLALEVLVGDRDTRARIVRRPAPSSGPRCPSARRGAGAARRAPGTRSAGSPSSCRRRGSAGCRPPARRGCRLPRRCARCAASPAPGSGRSARPRRSA